MVPSAWAGVRQYRDAGLEPAPGFRETPGHIAADWVLGWGPSFLVRPLRGLAGGVLGHQALEPAAVEGAEGPAGAGPVHGLLAGKLSLRAV